MENPDDDTDPVPMDESPIKQNVFTCTFDACGRAFKNNKYLKRHEQLHTKQPAFLCSRDDCAKYFRTEYHLKRHERSHETKKPKKTYDCSFCNKRCSDKFNLRLHEAVHTGDKPLKCDVCDAAFALRSRLKEHMKTHNTYTCAFSGCRFKAEKWSQLRKHLPVHKVKCPLCSSKFKSQELLAKHVSNHELTFKCSQCDAVYGKQSNLNTHIRVVHDKVKIKCTFAGCDKEFSHRHSLRQHMKSDHTERKKEKKEKKEPVTRRRVATAAVLSGYEAADDEKLMIMNQDKEYRMNHLQELEMTV